MFPASFAFVSYVARRVGSCRRRHGGHRAIVSTSEERQDQRGADQSQKHVPLRIPDIALRAEEGGAHVTSDDQRDPPLEQLPKRGEGEHHAQDEEVEPASAYERRLTQ